MNTRISGTSASRSALAGLALSAALFTGCGAEVEEPSMSREQLQTLAKDQLEATANAKAKSVDCEDGVAGKVGATQRCVLTASDGMRVGVTATVTKVDGDTVSIDVVADDKPME